MIVAVRGNWLRIISHENYGDDITVDDEDNEGEEFTQTMSNAQAWATLETVFIRDKNLMYQWTQTYN